MKYYPLMRSLPDDKSVSKQIWEEKFEGYGGFMCDKCFKPHILKINFSLEVCHSNKKKRNEIFPDLSFTIDCDCGNQIKKLSDYGS